LTTLDDFVRHRAMRADATTQLADRVRQVDPDAAHYLAATARRVAEGRFVVLLLGCFSSGKSSLLNAMLGQPVLPVKVNPCTAILTEVTYGATPSVTVRWRDGREENWVVEAFVQQFQLHTDEGAAGSEAADRFGDVERATVRWPLPLLQHGVVVVDTPGLDDDPTRTARTLASLPDADAVIFVLSATRFLSELERRTLRQDLLPLGLRNLFFPVTMVDLLDALVSDPAAEIQRMNDRAREALGPLCVVDEQDRFSERYAPLDARAGLRARWDRTAGTRREPVDEAELSRSGLSHFEGSLERFLVNERGVAQLHHLEAAIERVRVDLTRRAALDRRTASASVDELRRRHEEQTPRLQELQAIARRVARVTDAFIERQQQSVFHDLRTFVAAIERDLPEAVSTMDLGGSATLDLLTPRGRSRVEAKLREQLHGWLEERLAAWQHALRPTIEASLRALRAELSADADDFDRLAASIVTDFAGGALAVPTTADGEPEVEPVERWFSVAVGAVLLSPGAMAAGWSEGYEGALKGAASRLGVRVAVLTLGALLGPVGWAGVALYVVSDAVLLLLTGGGQLHRLRQHVADRLSGQLIAQVDAGRDELSRRVAVGFAPWRQGLVGAAEAEATALAAMLDATLAERERAVRDAVEREAIWTDVLASFSDH
jgi:hypothetical protein